MPSGTISFGPLGSYTFNQPKLVPAPPRNLGPPPEPMRCKQIPRSAVITQEEAKELFIKWAKSNCCRAAKPARDCHVTRCYSANALIYTLETFTESRSLVCNYAPYRNGESINAIQGGAIVNPWQLPCQPDTPFGNHQKRINLPNTDVVQPCFRCQSIGFLRCASLFHQHEL